MYLLILGCTLALIAAHLLLVPRLAEPEEGAELGKLPYAELLTAARVWPLLPLGAAAAAVAFTRPVAQEAVWVVFGSTVLVLVWVDALTTWLPRMLTWLSLAQLLLVTAAGAWFSDDWWLFGRFCIGAVATGVLFWCLWRFSRGIGFGDVRLSTLVGGMAGTMGLDGWFLSLLAGSLVGVIWSLWGRFRPAPGTKSAFAYGPALWSGPMIAVVALPLLG